MIGFVDAKHNFPGSTFAYCADGLSIVIGSLMGVPPVTVFVGEPCLAPTADTLTQHLGLRQPRTKSIV